MEEILDESLIIYVHLLQVPSMKYVQVVKDKCYTGQPNLVKQKHENEHGSMAFL